MEPLDLTPDMLLRAYAIGVFPMAEDRNDRDLFWIDPRMRGVLPLADFHIPRKLRKFIRRNHALQATMPADPAALSIHYNRDFMAVMEGCAEETERRPRTWINDQIMNLYGSLYHMGHGHSVEIWQQGQLVGGLYGISLGRAFFGESMFSRIPGASKIALSYLVARLTYAGFTLLDTQFITAHLAHFGAVEIPRQQYRDALAAALTSQADFMGNYQADEMLDFMERYRAQN